ncbi:hypothetical protein E1B28_013603 [Marasmius oreades]|uniref:Uncharacterized protein n=1 Tax=Marasmius oreades TaxID=181124 RepID=A0A9P7RQW9_9AGAR|nr:uncharacterized protein E1B28_013603 [Marasmius oreades]KAG7087655.1 hypothetical protein E1B28_013603 [Marasmius oreades]
MKSKSPTYGGSGALIALFFSIHTFVWVGSCILLLTVALVSNIRRHPIWVNMKLSWIFACFSFAFLLTTGQLYKSEPIFAICLVQAAAVSSVPILTSGTTLALAIFLLLATRPGPDAGGKMDRTRVTALVCVPYILPIGMFIFVLVFGLRDRGQVTLAKDWMVCGIRDPAVGHACNIAVVVIMLPTVIIEGWTITFVYRRRQVAGPNILSTLIRLSIFTFFGVLAIAISFSSRHFKTAIQMAVGNILQSLPPLAFIILFGLQRDILDTWAFWRREPLGRPREPNRASRMTIA